jgi:hypothetical protein
MPLAKIEDMGFVGWMIDIQRQQRTEAPHIPALRLVPGLVWLVCLQALQIHDDFDRTVIYRAQVHNGFGTIFCTAADALQM